MSLSPFRPTTGQRFWSVLENVVRPLIIFALLALLFPANLFFFSGGQADILAAIPGGPGLWLLSSYIVLGLTAVLIMLLVFHRRSLRRHPEREMQRLQRQVAAVVRQRLAERDKQSSQ